MKKLLFMTACTIRLFLLVICVLSCNIAYGFECTYKGARLKCKVNENDFATITYIDPKIKVAIIPSQVFDYKTGRTYSVKNIEIYSPFITPQTEEVIIEEGVEAIGKMAFAEYSKLKKITLPTTIKYIGKQAFLKMKDPKGIVFPSAEIGDMVMGSGIYFYQLSSPTQGDAPIATPAETTPVRENVSASKKTTPVIEVISLKKVDNSLGARTNQRIDYAGNICALLKVTLAKYKADYGGECIPEPRLNYITYNKEGEDYVWLVDKSKSLKVFSPDKEFEPQTIMFAHYNKNIPFLESGCVYELKIRIVYE